MYSVEKQSFQRKYRPFFRGAFWDKHLEKRLESCGKNFSSEGKKVFPGKIVEKTGFCPQNSGGIVQKFSKKPVKKSGIFVSVAGFFGDCLPFLDFLDQISYLHIQQGRFLLFVVNYRKRSHYRGVISAENFSDGR